MTRDEYLALIGDHAEAARGKRGRWLHHWCDRCGRCEIAGGYCSWCRTAAYTLTAHTHPEGLVCGGTGRSAVPTRDVLGTWAHPENARRRRMAA